MPKHPGTEKREQIKADHWPKEEAWTGMNELGWFKAPRTLPYLMGLMASKKLSGNKDPSSTYLELLSRHVDGGVVEMVNEAEHAYGAGYTKSRAVRTWQERMTLLEELGFIKSKGMGNQRHKYILLIHPSKVVDKLVKDKKVSAEWYEIYRARALETKEIKKGT